MSSFRDSDFDRLLRLSLKGALEGAEPSPAVWESIERRLLAPRDNPAGYGRLRGLAHLLRPHLLQIERYFLIVPVQYQRLPENRMPMLVQSMVYPAVGCAPLAFM